MRILILCVIFLFDEAWSQGGQCDRPGLNDCISPISLSNFNPVGYTYSDVQISQICGNLTSVKSCFSKKSASCSKDDLAGYQQSIESANYACGDGKNGWVKMQACFTTQNYLMNFSNCTEQIVPVQNLDMNVTGNNCKYNNALYSCYVNASKTCNSQDFVTAIFKLSNGKTLLSWYGCDLDATNWNTKVYSQCNTFLLGQCVQNAITADIQQYFSTQNILSTFSMPTDIFNKACGIADKVSTCITTTAKCEDDNPQTLFANSLTKSFQYICLTDRTGYNAVSKCSASNTQLFSSCAKDLSDCSSCQAYYKCGVDASKAKCGSSVTVENFLYKALQPVITKTISDCQLPPPTKGPTNAAVDDKRFSIMPIFLMALLHIFWK